MCNMLFTLHCLFFFLFFAAISFTEHAKNNESQRYIINCSQAVHYLKARNKTSNKSSAKCAGNVIGRGLQFEKSL